MPGDRTFTASSRRMRWTEMRDEHTPLLEVIESFLVHRHDLSPRDRDELSPRHPQLRQVGERGPRAAR